MENNNTSLVPPQYTGKELAVSASIELNDEQEASRFFQLALDRLLDVNNWKRVAEGLSATFQVTDHRGQKVERNVQQGDYLQIDIPGPGSREGNGFDWVNVEELRQLSDTNTESVGFRVRPSENPRGNSEDTAHFYDSSATSNFIVQRIGNKVTALVIDKNLKPNLDSESFVDRVRDAAVGATALAGISKIQWQNLVDGIVSNENE